MRDQMPKSKKDLNVERFPKLADALAKDKEFCSIVGRSSPDRAERLDAIIKNIAPTVEYTVSSSSHSISQNFAMHLARTPHNTLSPAAQRLQSMFLEYSQAKPRRRRSNKSVAKRIGFTGNDMHHRLHLPPIFPSLNWTLSIHHIPQKGTLSSSDLIPAYLLHPRNTIRPAVTCTSIVNSTKPCCNIPLMLTRKPSPSTRQPKSRSSSSCAILPKTTSTSSNLGLSTSSMTQSIVVATMFSATIPVRWLGLESALDSAVGRYLAGYAISKRQRRRPLV